MAVPGFDQRLLDWQNSFSLFGVPYSGPKDGLLHPEFIVAILKVESKYEAFGKIFNGHGVNLSVADAKNKFIKEEPKPTPKPEPTPDSKPETKTPESGPGDEEVWAKFLNQSLPVVGNVYSGDVATSAKKLEAAIGKEINKPMAGVIWNDSQKKFNTSVDDIKKALDLIQTHKLAPKQANLSRSERLARFSVLLEQK